VPDSLLAAKYPRRHQSRAASTCVHMAALILHIPAIDVTTADASQIQAHNKMMQELSELLREGEIRECNPVALTDCLPICGESGDGTHALCRPPMTFEICDTIDRTVTEARSGTDGQTAHTTHIAHNDQNRCSDIFQEREDSSVAQPDLSARLDRKPTSPELATSPCVAGPSLGETAHGVNVPQPALPYPPLVEEAHTLTAMEWNCARYLFHCVWLLIYSFGLCVLIASVDNLTHLITMHASALFFLFTAMPRHYAPMSKVMARLLAATSVYATSVILHDRCAVTLSLFLPCLTEHLQHTYNLALLDTG